ncbi:MurR/RpiR family transcriptional regulator [Listeria fleischmannii]|jgi:DNA-binding MurR/RpiR family transcriptional regulator|uniref:MurR/RpiR family transcriptional regulator n=1 Tax=Listeria fleischmannii TaxID=1069827 RepID=A0A841YFP7_9LIST|nr:MurR/RpiR family transcriptional regulator [Listeria fleischmannii]EIA19062.1 hypothetical protein KKC_14440 [Listeria fleischmannii subsp. coloradonensis]MBC1399053.1 MurR/RpiR family transcriptional regulator [Listeria fleischmannii]MBC1420025.1 MurR/RpiR family transcriptional regulator [Listeria fleischmannii]MBC1427306.1 MurR/RpiR family transcriptional regulator [Listeria fleischmannii]STY34601.1 Uncharacterized HTH-type transcriptional regulator ybbH [Listeria fleischmannii subsp. co
MANGSIINLINGILGSLPNSEQKVGKTILADPNFAVKASVQSLAKKSNASAAAVIRFSKSLNLDSFPELKRQLSMELAMPKKAGYYDIEPDESFDSIREKLVSNMIQTTQDTASQLKEEAIVAVCMEMEKAETIYAYGVGASWLIAEDIAQKWLRAGKNVFLSQDPHVLAMAFSAGKSNSVLIAISNSGETSEVLQLAKEAKHNGLKVVSLTRIGSNKLKTIADFVLETSRAPEAELRSTATSSRQAQLLVIDILFYYFASKRYEDMITHIQKSREATNRFRE